MRRGDVLVSAIARCARGAASRVAPSGSTNSWERGCLGATDASPGDAPSCASTSGVVLSRTAWRPSGCRGFAADAEAKEDRAVEDIGNAKVQALAQEIMALNLLESSWLGEILRKRLNIEKPAFGAMPMGAMAAMPAAPAAAAPADAAPAAEVKEKTDFEVKLESFSPEGKIKVIKEVRAITGLGLKEAKELVSARQRSGKGLRVQWDVLGRGDHGRGDHGYPLPRALHGTVPCTCACKRANRGPLRNRVGSRLGFYSAAQD